MLQSLHTLTIVVLPDSFLFTKTCTAWPFELNERVASPFPFVGRSLSFNSMLQKYEQNLAIDVKSSGWVRKFSK